MSEEWGPWIDHDGRGCPCVGEYAERIHSTGYVVIGIIRFGGHSWHWRAGYTRVIRYRIRKPKGMVILESLIADLPETAEV
jgi:hypothetical protein